MISSAPYSRRASWTARYGSGSITSPRASMPSSRRRSSVRSRRISRGRAHAVVVDHEARACGWFCGQIDRARGSAPAPPGARSPRAASAADGLVGDHQHVAGALRCGCSLHHSRCAPFAVAACPLPPAVATSTFAASTDAGTATLARSPFSTACTAPGHAVLVGAAHDLRDLVEVEDRRRRGHLPLERARAPRVAGRRRTEGPADDHVVEEHERRQRRARTRRSRSPGSRPRTCRRSRRRGAAFPRGRASASARR